MAQTTFLTLKQYQERALRDAAKEYGYTLAELRRMDVADSYTWDYYQEATNAIAAGFVPPASVWRTWPAQFRANVYRIPEVRRSEELGRAFLQMDHVL